MNKLLGILAVGMVAATAAHAVTYTTSTSIAFDPTAPSSNFGAPSKTTNGPSYTVQTGIDSSFFYVDIATNSVGDGNDFSNIYLGGAKFTNNLVIEVTNHRITSTASGTPYYELNGTGYTYSSTGTPATGYDISFALPVSFLETNPDSLAYASSPLVAGDQVRVSGSQSYGYTYVGGQSNFGDNRLGSQILPAGAVPEPAAWAMMLVGFGAIGGAVRTSKRSARSTFA